MYILKADGIVLPTPTDYAQGMMELSKADRNALGTMVKDFIAMKTKLDITWKFLTQKEMAILTAVKRKPSFTLEFISFETGKIATGQFYAGDLGSNAMQFKNGKVDNWLDTTMNFIEM